MKIKRKILFIILVTLFSISPLRASYFFTLSYAPFHTKTTIVGDFYKISESSSGWTRNEYVRSQKLYKEISYIMPLSIGIELGYRTSFTDLLNLKFDLGYFFTYNYNSVGYVSIRTSVHTIFTDMNVEFPLSFGIWPYIGAGFGFMPYSANAYNFDNSYKISTTILYVPLNLGITTGEYGLDAGVKINMNAFTNEIGTNFRNIIFKFGYTSTF